MRFNEVEVVHTIAPMYERRTAAEIARIMGCHPGTITRSLQRYGFKTRGPGERPPRGTRQPVPVVFDANARDWTPYHLTLNFAVTFCGLTLPTGFTPGHRMRRLCANCTR